MTPAAKPGKAVAKPEQALTLEQRLGEIDLADHVGCALLLDDIREFQKLISSTATRLEQAIVERAKADGATEYDLPNRLKAEVRFGTRTTIAGDVLEQELRKAGMPENRIGEIVTETVTYKAKATEAKKAARTNPAYAKALEAASTTSELQPSVTIRRR